jgi:hypothetical protein
LFLLSKSYSLLLGFKFLVLTGITYLLLKYRPLNRKIWAFLICFLSVYCIIAQLIGVYSNISVSHEIATSPPGEVLPMEQKQAMLSYSLIYGVIILYFPMFLSFLSFWAFEKIYL